MLSAKCIALRDVRLFRLSDDFAAPHAPVAAVAPFEVFGWVVRKMSIGWHTWLGGWMQGRGRDRCKDGDRGKVMGKRKG